MKFNEGHYVSDVACYAKFKTILPLAASQQIGEVLLNNNINNRFTAFCLGLPG